jgi:hypothetical protein
MLRSGLAHPGDKRERPPDISPAEISPTVAYRGRPVRTQNDRTDEVGGVTRWPMDSVNAAITIYSPVLRSGDQPATQV